MQDTNGYFCRSRRINQSQSQWERKPRVVLATEKNKNMQRLLVKPTQDFQLNPRRREKPTQLSCAETRNVHPELQQQLGSLPVSPGPDREFPQHREARFAQSVPEVPYPLARVTQNQHRLKPFPTEGHSAKQAPAAAARRIRATLPSPNIFPGRFSAPGRTKFPGRSSPLPAAILPEILLLTSRNTLPFRGSRKRRTRASCCHPGGGSSPWPVSEGCQERAR